MKFWKKYFFLQKNDFVYSITFIFIENILKLFTVIQNINKKYFEVVC